MSCVALDEEDLSSRLVSPGGKKENRCFRPAADMWAHVRHYRLIRGLSMVCTLILGEISSVLGVGFNPGILLKVR